MYSVFYIKRSYDWKNQQQNFERSNMKLLIVLLAFTSCRLISVTTTKPKPAAQRSPTDTVAALNERIERLKGKKVARRIGSFRSRTIQLSNCFYDRYDVLCIGTRTTNDGLYTSFIDERRKRRDTQANWKSFKNFIINVFLLYIQDYARLQ